MPQQRKARVPATAHEVAHAPERPLRIMVSSSVYRQEELLEKVYAALQAYGYEVWMSHKGTIPTSPELHNFENCIAAVDNCDAFLGIITGFYGSGVRKNDLGITHQEVLRAIERQKLRWFLAHSDVTLARQLLKQFRFNPDGSRRRNFRFQKTAVLDDIRVLDMYEAATTSERGNWVQTYRSHEDVLRFVETQFSDPKRIRALLESRNQKPLIHTRRAR